MPRVDQEKSFLYRLSELQPTGSGIAMVVSFRDRSVTTNDGITVEVPPGMAVRYLGDGPSYPGEDYCEFAVWDPTRVEVSIEFIEGTDMTEAIRKGQELKREGWTGKTYPYNDHLVSLGWRPITQAQQAPSTTPAEQ